MMPIDLLQLARVSKHFRNTFMSKRSAKLWAAARQSVPCDLPDPPAMLSEPKYTALLFGSNCFVSLRSTSSLR